MVSLYQMYPYGFVDAVFAGTKGRWEKHYNDYCLQHSLLSNYLHFNSYVSKRRTN